MSERQGVEIDYCSKCRGVWLDRGELDKIIERASSEMTSRPQPDRKDDRYEQYDKHRNHYNDKYDKRKKSFLHELFD